MSLQIKVYSHDLAQKIKEELEGSSKKNSHFFHFGSNGTAYIEEDEIIVKGTPQSIKNLERKARWERYSKRIYKGQQAVDKIEDLLYEDPFVLECSYGKEKVFFYFDRSIPRGVILEKPKWTDTFICRGYKRDLDYFHSLVFDNPDASGCV